MKILITGGAGYFGGALSRALLETHYSVRILDLQETKYIPIGAEYIKGDVRNKSDVEKALDDIDIVFHLAFVQTPSTLPDDVQFSVNVEGTRNLLNGAKRLKLKRFVFISTIEVYGSKPIIPIKEENVLEPVGIYSVHKIQCEKMCDDYYRKFGVPCTIARLPLICGEGYYNHKPFLAMLDRVVDNKLVFLPSSGNVLADMIHIDDAISALKLLAFEDNAIGEIFHFSSSKPATHLEMVKQAIDVANSKSTIVFMPNLLVRLFGRFLLAFHLYHFPLEQIDYLLNDFVCDNSKARKLLGYNPIYSVTDSIGKLIRGYISDRDFIRERQIGHGLKEF
jgi:nucleoside-diphosphate-sugar epimerase